MLPKKYRLPASLVFHNALFAKGNFFSAKAQSNTLSYDRYGFVVGKAVDTRAVVRNRIKRVARSIVEKEALENAHGKDVLFIAQKQAGTAENIAIKEDITSLLKKINL